MLKESNKVMAFNSIITPYDGVKNHVRDLEG